MGAIDGDRRRQATLYCKAQAQEHRSHTGVDDEFWVRGRGTPQWEELYIFCWHKDLLTSNVCCVHQ